jgi:hypothetical protein
MNCLSDHAQIILGVCCECKAEYCAACVVPHPGNNAVQLCRECGAALLSKCLCRSLLAAVCGFLLGTGLTSFWHWSTRASLGFSLSGGYVLWSIFWGWHYGAGAWQRLYERLRQLLRLEIIALVLLALIRTGAALVVGVCGGGGLKAWQAMRRLRQESGKQYRFRYTRASLHD